MNSFEGEKCKWLKWPWGLAHVTAKDHEYEERCAQHGEGDYHYRCVECRDPIGKSADDFCTNSKCGIPVLLLFSGITS